MILTCTHGIISLQKQIRGDTVSILWILWEIAICGVQTGLALFLFSRQLKSRDLSGRKRLVYALVPFVTLTASTLLKADFFGAILFALACVFYTFSTSDDTRIFKILCGIAPGLLFMVSEVVTYHIFLALGEDVASSFIPSTTRFVMMTTCTAFNFLLIFVIARIKVFGRKPVRLPLKLEILAMFIVLGLSWAMYAALSTPVYMQSLGGVEASGGKAVFVSIAFIAAIAVAVWLIVMIGHALHTSNEQAEQIEQLGAKIRANERRECLWHIGKKQIHPGDVIHISGGRNFTTIHTTCGDHTTKIPLKILERDLPGGFMRCHRSFIVNLSHIREFDGKILKMSDGADVDVSASYLNDVRGVLGGMQECSVSS